ncbi:hypothetical protein SCUCBS95973_003041 [Sporothrix curviconia]|uniref:HCNGP-like protein n=1 Tax=Sporothrix curviconia TaxID=1260050 RepID=A0ABP0BC42_9PEZI
MAGLVGYDSSDDESDGREEPQEAIQAERTPGSAPGPVDGNVPIGPAIGPARPPQAGNDLPSLDEDDDATRYDDASLSPPLSPYSSDRAAVRQLTMPRVPDFDIPGSPPPGENATSAESLTALNKKFATFLELKQKKDTHFHARLAQSEAMKNPALMDKLMAFVGLPLSGAVDDNADDDGGSSVKSKRAAARPVDTAVASAQYATTLPLDLWDPASFPPEAYRRSLRRLQEEAAKQRARAPGERVDFVSSAAGESASTPAVGGQDSSRSGTPAAGAATGKRKSRFD